MCRHAGFRGGGRSGNSLAAWEGSAAVRSGRTALWVVRFVSCFPLFCIVVVAVPFVCCSVKLPLSRPTSFCLFLPILLCTPAGGGAATWRFCCRRQPKPEQPLISHMKNSTNSSSSKVPSIAPSGMGAAVDALIWRSQTTTKREKWEDDGHPLKKVVRKE